MISTADMSSQTLQFLIQLKATNGLYFNAIVNCAKRSPKLVLQTMRQAKETLKYSDLNLDGVNPFEICKAVNQGKLSVLSFHGLVNEKANELRIQQVLQQIKDTVDFS